MLILTYIHRVERERERKTERKVRRPGMTNAGVRAWGHYNAAAWSACQAASLGQAWKNNLQEYLHRGGASQASQLGRPILYHLVNRLHTAFGKIAAFCLAVPLLDTKPCLDWLLIHRAN